MRKSHHGNALSREDIERNKALSKTCYRVEQSFAILHRKFHCKKKFESLKSKNKKFGFTKVSGY